MFEIKRESKKEKTKQIEPCDEKSTKSVNVFIYQMDMSSVFVYLSM